MTKPLERSITVLHHELAIMSGYIERSIDNMAKVIETRDGALIAQVVEDDDLIDQAHRAALHLYYCPLQTLRTGSAGDHGYFQDHYRSGAYRRSLLRYCPFGTGYGRRAVHQGAGAYPPDGQSCQGYGAGCHQLLYHERRRTGAQCL